MLIEAFSAARDPADSTTNEDALVVLPGRAYAVIDGVTDRSGLRYDGMLSGRYAACLVAREVERDDAAKIRQYLSPKGSTPRAFADDRTYLGVRL